MDPEQARQKAADLLNKITNLTFPDRVYPDGVWKIHEETGGNFYAQLDKVDGGGYEMPRKMYSSVLADAFNHFGIVSDNCPTSLSCEKKMWITSIPVGTGEKVTPIVRNLNPKLLEKDALPLQVEIGGRMLEYKRHGGCEMN